MRSVGILLGLGCALLSCTAAPPAPTNLLLVSLDTLRPDHTGLYGSERPTTPNLDRLARESLLLAQFRSHAPETRPSHMSMFTSQFPFVHQRVGGLPTLAEQLRAEGFATAAFTDGGEVSHAFGFDRGFELYADAGGGLGKHLGAFGQWLEQRRPARWFAFLHTYEIHDPYHPGPPYESLFFPEYRGDVTGARSQALLQRIRRIGAFQGSREPPPVLGEEDRRQIEALYEGGIRKADEEVGRLIGFLRERGLLQNTLLVIVSDHGEEFWEHGGVLHAHTLYGELLSIVGMVRFPDGRGAGRILGSPVQALDLAPTLLSVLGAPPLPTARGDALDLTGEVPPDRPLFSEKRSNFCLVRGRYKYIGQIGSPHFEIYDLAEDPGEQEPLAGPRLREGLVESLLGSVAERRAGIKKDVESLRVEYPPHAAPPLDQQTEEQLRRLGYIQ